MSPKKEVDCNKVEGSYVTLWLRKELVQAVDEAAKSLGVSRGTFIRNSIIHYLNFVRPLVIDSEPKASPLGPGGGGCGAVGPDLGQMRPGHQLERGESGGLH